MLFPCRTMCQNLCLVQSNCLLSKFHTDILHYYSTKSYYLHLSIIISKIIFGVVCMCANPSKRGRGISHTSSLSLTRRTLFRSVIYRSSWIFLSIYLSSHFFSSLYICVSQNVYQKLKIAWYFNLLFLVRLFRKKLILWTRSNKSLFFFLDLGCRKKKIFFAFFYLLSEIY